MLNLINQLIADTAKGIETLMDRKYPKREEKQLNFVQAILGRHFEAMDSKRNSLIEKLAYSKWEKAGRPEGNSETYWLEAEQEIKNNVYSS